MCFAAAFPNYLSGAGYMWFSQDCIDYQGGHGCIYNTAASSSGWGCRLCNTQPGTDGGYEYGECPPCVERHYASPPPPAPPTSPPPVPPGWSFAEYWANPVLLHLNISLSLSALPDGAESLCVSLAPAAISDGAGLAALACRQCVNLVEKIPPTLSVSLDANNNLLATFDEPVRLASHLGGGDLTAAAFSVSYDLPLRLIDAPPADPPDPAVTRLALSGAGVCSSNAWGGDSGKKKGYTFGQWANSATGSSQYDEGASATGFAGATGGNQNTQQCGDNPDVWAPAVSGLAPEFLEVSFSRKVIATALTIWETGAAPFVQRVELKDVDGVVQTIWEGDDTTSCPGILPLDGFTTEQRIASAIIHTAAPGYESRCRATRWMLPVGAALPPVAAGASRSTSPPTITADPPSSTSTAPR